MEKTRSYYGNMDIDKNVNYKLDEHIANEWIANLIDKQIDKFKEDLRQVLHNIKKDSEKALSRTNNEFKKTHQRISVIEDKMNIGSKWGKKKGKGISKEEENEMEEMRNRIMLALKK